MVMPELTGFAVAENQEGGLEIVAVARSLQDSGEEPFSAVWSARQAPGTAEWSRRSLGGPPSELAGPITIVPNQDGRLESAVVAGTAGDPEDPGGAVWHAWQTRPGGDWSSWRPLATPPGANGIVGSVLAQDHDGRLEVFTRTTGGTIFAGTLWRRRQPEPGHGPWENWQSLDIPNHNNGGIMDPPLVVRNHGGRLEVFTVAMGGLWHRSQTTDSGNDWSAWTPLQWPAGGIVAGEVLVGVKGEPVQRSLVLVRDTDGWLGVWTIAYDNSIWHRRQRPGGEWDQWMPFKSHPGWLTGLAARTQPDGRLVLFAISCRPHNRTELWLGQEPDFDWQEAKWTLLDIGPEFDTGPTAGGTFKSPALVPDSQGRLHLFCQVTGVAHPGTSLYIRSQQQPNSDEWEAGRMLDLSPPQSGQTG
jgi:hypothetical protein